MPSRTAGSMFRGRGMGRGVVEQSGQISEIRHEKADRGFVKRDGHDFNFSGWHRVDIWSPSDAIAYTMSVISPMKKTLREYEVFVGN